MPHPFQRTQRIGDQIQQTLASLLTSKAQDPRFQHISITAVDVSPDVKNATIFVSKLQEGSVESTIQALNKASGFFRHVLATKLNMRHTPKLKFVHDDSTQRAHDITKLINEANKDTNEK